MGDILHTRDWPDDLWADLNAAYELFVPAINQVAKNHPDVCVDCIREVILANAVQALEQDGWPIELVLDLVVAIYEGRIGLRG